MGIYGSNNWKYSDDTIVNDIYGNRMKFGVLKILKARGYYNNRKAKGASTNGTYKTYGDEYSVDKGDGSDPNLYEDKI